MTAFRSPQFFLTLALSLALGGFLLNGQEPAAAPSEVATTPARGTPSEKAAPKKSRASEDAEDDRPGRTHRTARSTPTPTSTPTATPARKPGFFKRVFGKKPNATPTPSPTVASPTPKPKPKVKKDDDDDDVKPKRSTEKPASTETHDTTEKPERLHGEDTETPPKRTAATPTAKGGKRGVKETVKSAPADLAKEQRVLADATKSGDADAIEKAKYDLARAKAANDEHVRDLKAKADGATSEDEGRKAQRAYNRALFEKMRKLDDSITDRIDRTESAVLKRLGPADD